MSRKNSVTSPNRLQGEVRSDFVQVLLQRNHGQVLANTYYPRTSSDALQTGKPGGIQAARKLRRDRRENRWADAGYKKRVSSTSEAG